MNTTVVLMILILYQPATGTYQEAIAPFNSMKECLEYKQEVLKDKKPDPKKYYILVCEKPIPTTSVEI